MNDLVRKHPVAAAAVAAGIGALLYAALRSSSRDAVAAQRAGESPANPSVKSPGRKSPARPVPMRRDHDTGAMDMQFTAHRANGKEILFRFAWKKRPVDMPDAQWPVDRMGFTATRPDGKHTAFTFTRKTRPVPPGYGDPSPGGIRPGLGEAFMEFVSTAPGRGDFRFSWSKIPHAGAAEARDKAPKAVPRKRRSR